MSTMFGRGLRRLFGIKPKKKRAYIYEYKPKIEAITFDPKEIEESIIEEFKVEPVKKVVKKKSGKKKSVKKKISKKE